MSILDTKPSLKPDEEIQWSAAATHPESSWYASGGKLIVTNRRMFFQPNRFDAAFGRGRWECPLDAIQGVESVPRDRTRILSGGARRGLGVATRGGLQTFVVNGLNEKLIQLTELLKRTPHLDGQNSDPRESHREQ